MTKPAVHPLHARCRAILAEERKANPGTLTQRALAANEICLFFSDLEAARVARPGAYREDAFDRLRHALGRVIQRSDAADAVTCLQLFHDALKELLAATDTLH